MYFKKDSSVLITGGTGSFGKYLVKNILIKYPKVKRLIVYSRDELKQWEIREEFPTSRYPSLRTFLGDVRDYSRLKRALDGVDTVIHCAALKQVPTAEYDPFEYINTNIYGAENIIKASLETPSIQRVIALSTDKASAPINLYGATKLCSDKCFVAANNIKGFRDIRFCVVRYGNVMGSRGSVIPYFLKKRKDGVIPITDIKMTRFNITLEQAMNTVFWCLENSKGGEIFVPKLPSYRIMDLAKAIAPNAKHEIVGIRPGEKLHETMITNSDSASTYDLGNIYAIFPNYNDLSNKYRQSSIQLSKVDPDFSYDSFSNDKFLDIGDIRKLIKKHLDEDFTPT